MSASPGGTLVVQTSFIGDMVLTTPLLAHLAGAGAGPVDVLALPSTAPLLANNPHVRTVHVYDKRARDRGAAGFVRTARLLRRSRYREAYFAQGSVRSGALGWAARIPDRVGFDTSAGRSFYTRIVGYDESRHHAARLLSLAAAVSNDESIRPRLYPGDAERAAVDALFGATGQDDGPLVALAPGSIWGTKRWPYYVELAALVPYRVLVIGGKEDTAAAAQVVARVPSAIDATGRLSLLASAEAIRRCRAIVTNDSAPQHLASAVGTPTITIFGPTVPEFGFGPLAPRHAVLGHDGLACRPCDRHGPRACPLGHWRCMREIEATLVSETLQGLI